MAVYQVQANGNAPSGLQVGDYVNTAGGMYMVAAPGSPGASYNPASGYWSVKADSASYSSPSVIQSAINSAQQMAQSNTEQSQAFAREQMEFQKEQNAKAMSFNAAEAEKNRQWQQTMSNTAHQREVKDLIAAGLNPILSAGGSGAAVTSGATASGVTSAGASGQVDTSYMNMVASIFNAMINRETSLDIAKMQAAVNTYMSDNSLSAALGSASINAQSMLNVAQKNFEYDQYMKQNYPQNLYGGLSSILNSVYDMVNGKISGPTGKLFAGTIEAFEKAGKEIASLFKKKE